MAKRKLLIIHQHGLVRFANCHVCNERFESKLLNDSEAKEEILALYRQHRCKRMEHDPERQKTKT